LLKLISGNSTLSDTLAIYAEKVLKPISWTVPWRMIQE